MKLPSERPLPQASVTYFDPALDRVVTESCEGSESTVAAFLRSVADRMSPKAQPQPLYREGRSGW